MSCFLLEQFPNGREGTEQTDHQQRDRDGGDAGKIGFLVFPDVVQDRPGDEEDDDRPHGFTGETTDWFVPGHALCKRGLVVDFVEEGHETHRGGADATREQGGGYWSVDFFVCFFS